MRTRLVHVALLAGLAPLVAACASGSDSAGNTAGARTVHVNMRDNAYSPDHLAIRRGETVRFVFRNMGKVAHDAVLGNEKAQSDHEMEMSSGSGMHHGGGDAVTADPGKTAMLTHTFRNGGDLLIGCHELGHYAAGMKLTIDVA
jgi:uncharacterized cupredoxin-like copper-binding protein